MKKQLFCYATLNQSIPANSTLIPQINFNNDSDFDLVEVRSTNQNAGEILTQLSFSSGELFSNVALDVSLFSGNAYPVRLPEPVCIPANSQLNVQLTNTTGGAITTQIQLWGYKKSLYQ